MCVCVLLETEYVWPFLHYRIRTIDWSRQKLINNMNSYKWSTTSDMFSTLWKACVRWQIRRRDSIFGVLFFRLWLFPGGPFRPVGGGVHSHPSQHPPCLRACLLMCTSLSQHCHYHWCYNAVFVLPTLLVRRISICYVCKLRLKVWLIRKKRQKHFFCWSQSEHVERWFVKKIRNNLKRGPKRPRIHCTYSIF